MGDTVTPTLQADEAAESPSVPVDEAATCSIDVTSDSGNEVTTSETLEPYAEEPPLAEARPETSAPVGDTAQPPHALLVQDVRPTVLWMICMLYHEWEHNIPDEFTR